MTDDVVRLAYQFVAGKPADFDEGRIGVNDATFEVGFGYEVLVVADGCFDVGDGQVFAHGSRSVGWYVTRPRKEHGIVRTETQAY